MKVLLLGGAGFIGTNLAIRLSKRLDAQVTVADRAPEYFETLRSLSLPHVSFAVSTFDENTDFDALLEGQDMVFHLVSTTVPTTSNAHIYEEMRANVDVTALLLEACVRQRVGRVVFFSSGGTVYGKASACPLAETVATQPISAYGIQKVTIEKLLYLYGYLYGLDWRVVRLSNPYGPYQRPNGILGAATTFIYKALRGEEITVYGDGSVVRDFIYIDDAIDAVLQVAFGEADDKTFNIGSGKGTSIASLLAEVQDALGTDANVRHLPGRKVDVPVNYLDISRYESAFGTLRQRSLRDGILQTADFMHDYYRL